MKNDFDSWVEEVESLINADLENDEKDYVKRLFNAQMTPHEASSFMMREDNF